jgi:hypothetical protein
MTETDPFAWLEQRIEWDKAHPMRYRLRRVWHHAAHPRKTYRQFVYWPIRTFVERGRKGVSVSDTWSFDVYIAGVMAEGLSRLRQGTHGYPMNLDEEKWDSILAEMETGFRAWSEHSFSCGNAEIEAQRQVRRSIRLMHRWFGHLWD